MAVAGTLIYETKLNTDGFQRSVNSMTGTVEKGGSKIKSIIAALGITKIISSAISTINASIDGAISRIDTLNNFPKVMSNLGISSEDASKAINTLSDKLKGIPTTLDDAALAVQRFTSKNGDVKKSTEIFLAVNNALLAGGASAEIQSSALEQLSQSYAKGKPDMMEWRAIQTAMPAQLKQISSEMLGNKDALDKYLKSAQEYADNNPLSSTASELIEQLKAVENGTGDMTTALGTGLRTGVISMDEFIDTIVKLNKDGTKNFQSFEKQARNATGGIKTSVTNMKTAITRGVANVISSVDKLLQKNGLGGISGVLSNIGKTSETAFKKFATAIEKVNVKALINVLKTLIPVIAGVTAGFVAYQVVLKTISAINIAKNILSAVSSFLSLIPAITSATDAMALLNVAFNANPVGLIVAGVAGLTAGLIALHSALSKNKTEQEQVNQTLKDYDETMKEADKSRQKYLDTNMNEVQNYRNLYDELINLADENGKVKEGYEERAKFISGTLNEALGTEITVTDGVIQNYQKISVEIANVIKAKRAKVLLDAQEEKYNKAKDEAAKLEEAYATAVKEANKAEEERNNYISKVAEQYGITEERVKELLNTTNVFDDSLEIHGETLLNIKNKNNELNTEYDKTQALLEETGNKYADNQKTIGEYETSLTNLSNGNYDAVLKMYEDTTNYQGKTKEQTYNNYQDAITAQQLYLDSLKRDKDKYDTETYNALVSSTESKIKQLESEQAKYKTITEEGQKKTKQAWNKGLSEQLSEITGHKVEFRKTSNGNVQAYIDGIKEGKPMTKKEAKALAETMTSEIKNQKREAKKSGEYLIEGTTSGIKNRNKQSSAFSAIASFGNSLLAKLRISLKEHSPSKASEQDAKYLIEGFNVGLTKSKGKSLKLVEEFGNEILNEMQDAVNVETGKMSFSGTSGSVTEILNANATFEGTMPISVNLDGEKIYQNQETIKARKALQYGGVK